MTQSELFEPSGAEVLPLAQIQQRKADQFNRQADACTARGWRALALIAARQSMEHRTQAECLAMLAEFELLGGVTQ